MMKRTGRAAALLVLMLGLLAAFPAATGANTNESSGQAATRWIVALQTAPAGSERAVFQAAVGDAALTPLSHLPGTYLAEFDGRTLASDAVARLLAHPAVRYVEPDLMAQYLWEPNDAQWPQQEWARTVQLPEAWAVATGQPSTVVAVIDSGVSPDHPDLAGKVLPGHDFMNNDGDASDDVGHGTAVAGIIAARGNDGLGIAGAAMDTMILPAKVGNADGALVSHIAQGIRWAVDQGASVINISLGAEAPSATMEEAIRYAYDRNVVVVVAAGNHAQQVWFPASYQQTISVGASTLDGTALAPFSSRLSRVDLVAPGVTVFAPTWILGSGNGWDWMTGTSFAAPIVSGTVALMRSMNPGMPVEAVRAALTGTARQTMPADTLGAGAGLLDAGAAVRQSLLPAMASTWQVADEPVRSGVVHRTWLWGPSAFIVGTEPYVQTQRGERLVAYFDKARMEITNPYGDASDPWYVTNGLLATELISGRVQLGHAEFHQQAPATVPVAGDPDDPFGPTYATLSGLTSAPAHAEGAVIVQTIDRAGQVGEDGRFAAYGVVAQGYIPETGHRVASVFADYLNSSGLVLRDGRYQHGPLFDPPFYATGYPITEAYWTRAKVAGQVQDILVQCFERRCLTYTPSNPPGWQVEMGNVGRHYYQWRVGTPPVGPAWQDPARLAAGPQ